MSTALDKVSADATTIRSSITDALAFISSIGTEEQSREAYDRVQLAKEWARIRKVGREVRRDLLRLEIHLLRKVAQLGTLTALPTSHRAAAKFFADKTDEQVEALLGEFAEDVTSSVTIYRRVLCNDEQTEARRLVTSGDYARPDHVYLADETRDWAVQEYSGDLKAGLAALLEHYYDEDEDGFSVLSLAEQVCQSVGLDERSAIWGAHEGLLEVCRKAIRDAPTVAVMGTDAPRFVTCLRRAPGLTPYWIRVPFHAATLEQLHDMLTLRREQAGKAAAVADSLLNLWNALDEQLANGEGPREVTLGELAARVAFPKDEAGAA